MSKVYLMIAWRNLRQGGRRTWILGFAIGIVTLLLVVLSALGAGLEATMIRSASTLLSGHVNVGGFYKVTPTQAAPVVTGAAALRALVEREVEGVDFIIDRARGWAKAVSDQGSFYTGLVGVDIAQEQGLRSVLQVRPSPPGAPASDLGALDQPNTAVIFAGQAERLEVGVGDVITMTAETGAGVNNTVDVRVVAVVEDVGFLSAWSIFVPKSTVNQLYQLKDDTTGAVQIYLKDPDRAPAVMAGLRETLTKAGYTLMDHEPQAFFMKFDRVAGEDWTGQRLDLTTWKDEVSYLLWILTGFATIRWLMLGTLMVIIGIGIMNTMWMSIRERTSEIGTLRAIGMRPRAVLGMFVLEGALLGAVAAGAGAVLGGLIAWIVDAAAITVPMKAFQMVLMSDRLHLEVQLGDLLTALFVITAVTCLAAIFPAWRAARLRPVSAIHHVG